MKTGNGYLLPQTMVRAVEAWMMHDKDIRKASISTGLSIATIKKSVNRYRDKKHDGQSFKSKI